MAACITLAGESLIAQKQSAREVLDISTFVLAYVPDLDPATPIDRAAGMPPAEQIAGTWAYTQKGFVDPNRVVYSLMLGSNIGDFDWNWIGLVTAEGTLFAVSTVPVQQKRRNIQPIQTGNNVTRNFMVSFDGAQELTAITVEASTWQHDFTEQLRAKEPAIPAGKNTDFWTGSKSWADLATAVRGVVMAGLSTASATAVTAADSLLAALGKLQAQITSLGDNKLDKAAAAASATKLATARTINGVAFNGTANITISAAATAASVMSAHAAAGAGTVGQVALLSPAKGTGISPGGTYAGSGLVYAAAMGSLANQLQYGGIARGAAVSGTWRALGFGTSSDSSYQAILFVRIS